MTEIMPVPRNLSFTVLPAGGLGPYFILLQKDEVDSVENNISIQVQVVSRLTFGYIAK